MSLDELKTKWNRPARVVRLYLRDGNRCAICGEMMLFELACAPHPRFATVDHIRPKSKGGVGRLENLRLACRGCNGARGNEYTPAMGGVGRWVPPPIPPRTEQSPRDLTVYVRCRRCDTRYAVFGWASRHPDGLCHLCVQEG